MSRFSTDYPEDNPAHPDHDATVAKAWKGRDKKERNVEVRLFAGMRMVRVEFLDDRKKHLDHVDFTFEEYAHICGFKSMVEPNDAISNLKEMIVQRTTLGYPTDLMIELLEKIE